MHVTLKIQEENHPHTVPQLWHTHWWGDQGPQSGEWVLQVPPKHINLQNHRSLDVPCHQKRLSALLFSMVGPEPVIIISEAQCKMKMQGSLFKMYPEFQDVDNITLNQAQSLSKQRIVQVAHAWSQAWVDPTFHNILFLYQVGGLIC